MEGPLEEYMVLAHTQLGSIEDNTAESHVEAGKTNRLPTLRSRLLCRSLSSF